MNEGFLDYEFVSKGWGYEKIFYNGDYCGKLLFIAKKKKLSFHYHKLKEETFYLQSGKLHLFYSYQDDLDKANHVIMKKGDIFHVPPQLRHRMQAERDSYLFEFSTHSEDSDSYRVVKGD